MSSAPQRAASLEAVLLAAGAGSRLGTPKALLTVRGVWILPRLVSALARGGASRVHVVLRATEYAELRARAWPPETALHAHDTPEDGRTSSLLLGLAAVPQEAAVLIHPCDVPLLSASAVRRLVSAWSARTDRDLLAARLVTPGGRGGHPLLLGHTRVKEARALQHHDSLRTLLHTDPARVLNVAHPSDPGPFLDVDTPEQLALIESLLAESPSHSGKDQR